MKNLFFLVVLFCSCNEPVSENNSEVSDLSKDFTSTYPKVIIEKNLTTLYDQSKWLIYCIHSDETCKFYDKLNIKEQPTFGTLDLRIDTVYQINDTTEINFSFYYDSLKCDVNTTYNYGSLTSGVAFKGNNNAPIYFLRETTMHRFTEKGIKSRYDNPLQPDVLVYIKNNQDKLNKWFKNEAKRRGILQ